MVIKADSRNKIRVMIDMFKSCSEVELPLANVAKVATIYNIISDLGCSTRGLLAICWAFRGE